MKKEILSSLAQCGLIPVAVIDEAKNALPAAEAMLAGGVGAMEVTFRTPAAADAIQAVAVGCPDMLVGAGTVVTQEQCQRAVEMGARFIVSPGLNREVVEWCIDHEVAVIPGCVTPSEIMAAMEFDLRVVKFFPANVYGGLQAMKALSGPFGGVKFIPTGGINAQNIGEYIAAPFIHAVGGSWVCPRAEMAAGNFGRITALCAESRRNLLGYEVAHVGINTADCSAAEEVTGTFGSAFGFAAKNGGSSLFASNTIEVMKSQYLGRQGHLAVRTNRIDIAIADLEQKGFAVDIKTAKYKGERMTAVYLKDEIGGFAIHLLQR